MPQLQRTSHTDGSDLVPTGGGVPVLASPLEDAIDLGWYVGAIRRRWTWLVTGALAGAVAGGMFAASRTPLFEASTTLMAPPPSTQTVPVDPQHFRALLENGALASEVIAELGLGDAPHRLTPQRFLEQALTVETMTGTNVVKAKVRLRDPKLAASASLSLSQKAILLARQLAQQEGSEQQGLLKEHLTAAADRLVAAEKALLTFQQQAQVELLKEDTEAMLGERGDLLKLVVAIESEKARLTAAEQEIKRHERVLSVGRAVGAEDALRREMRIDADDVPPASSAQRRNEAGASPNPSPVPPTAASADSLDLSNPFINPVYQTLDFQIATSRARLAALEKQRQELVDVRKLGGETMEPLSELYGRQIELARLQTSFELARRVHSDLVVRYEESRTRGIGNTPLLQLVAAAIPPDRPLPRRTVQFAALGFAVGLAGFGLLVLVWEGR